MVARDPLRGRTLSAHPKAKHDKGRAVEFPDDPHVGSTVNADDDVEVKETPPVAGRSTSQKPSGKKEG